MHSAIRLPAKLGASLAKWGIIGVLWICSVFAITSSALVMDAISDAMWKLAGIATVDLAQKRKITAADENLQAEKKKTKKVKSDLAKEKDLNAANKEKVRKHGKKVRGSGKKMVGRNLADATTSIIPVIGGFASVTFAVADVHAACELVALQNELETSLGIDSEPSNFKTYCIESINQVNATATEAEEVWINLRENMPDLPDMPDISASELWDDWKCKASFSC